MTNQPRSAMAPGSDKARRIATIIQSAMDAAYQRGIADTQADHVDQIRSAVDAAYQRGLTDGRKEREDSIAASVKAQQQRDKDGLFKVTMEIAEADAKRDAERAQHAADWFKRNRPTADDLPIRKSEAGPGGA